MVHLLRQNERLRREIETLEAQRRKLQEAQTRAGESSMLDHIKSLHLDVTPLGPAAAARRPVRRKMSYGDSTVPSSRYATPLQG